MAGAGARASDKGLGQLQAQKHAAGAPRLLVCTSLAAGRTSDSSLVACECTAGAARGKCARGTGGQLWHGGGGGGSGWHLAPVELQIPGSGRGTGREQRGTQASGTGANNKE